MFSTIKPSQWCYKCCNSPLKKQVLFAGISFTILFSAVFIILTSIYAGVADDEWIEGTCIILNVEWRFDLYDIYDVKTDNNTANNIANNNNVNFIDADNDTIQNITSVKVQGWIYMVDMIYKNIKIRSIIRDPSASKVLAPLYSVGKSHKCIGLIEKLKPENVLQDDYNNYQGSNIPDEGGSMNEVTDEEKKADVFFVVTTQWPKIDQYTLYHHTSQSIRWSMIALSFFMIIICMFFIKGFHDWYTRTSVSGEPGTFTTINFGDMHEL